MHRVTCFVLVNGLLFSLQDFVDIVPSSQTCSFVAFRVPQPKCVNVAIDCDREIERIHSLFLINLDKLDELQSKFCANSLKYRLHLHIDIFLNLFFFHSSAECESQRENRTAFFLIQNTVPTC